MTLDFIGARRLTLLIMDSLRAVDLHTSNDPQSRRLYKSSKRNVQGSRPWVSPNHQRQTISSLSRMYFQGSVQVRHYPMWTLGQYNTSIGGIVLLLLVCHKAYIIFFPCNLQQGCLINSWKMTCTVDTAYQKEP